MTFGAMDPSNFRYAMYWRNPETRTFEKIPGWAIQVLGHSMKILYVVKMPGENGIPLKVEDDHPSLD